MIFVDGHVHIYDCFDLDLLFNSALENFQAAAGEIDHGRHGASLHFLLLLAEGEQDTWLTKLAASMADEGRSEQTVSRQWAVRKEGGEESLAAFGLDCPDKKLYLVRGRQIVTREKIEVLALFCSSPVRGGGSLVETLAAVVRSGGLPVLPWGVGKWLGKRGDILQRFLGDHGAADLYLGDNGGRPLFWPTPSLFDLGEMGGAAVLPGTDPLPLPEEAARVGSYGFYLEEEVPDNELPPQFLKRALLSREAPVFPFGRLQSNGRFCMNQLRLRLARRAQR